MKREKTSENRNEKSIEREKLIKKTLNEIQDKKTVENKKYKNNERHKEKRNEKVS